MNRKPELRIILESGWRLLLYGLLTTGIIAGTWVFTRDRIDQQIRHSQLQRLTTVVPHVLFDNDLANATIALPEKEALGAVRRSSGWIARFAGAPVAVIVPVTAPDGYNGRIELLVGIDKKGGITGVRAVSHRETPGFGNGIETEVSDWILAFTGHSRLWPEKNGWAVRKAGGEFDQMTGATVTSRAVVAAVYRALEYFHRHSDTLLRSSSPRPKNSNE